MVIVQILESIHQLETILRNPLLETATASEMLFDNLPFENQLRYMCCVQIAELYTSLQRFGDAITFYISVCVDRPPHLPGRQGVLE